MKPSLGPGSLGPGALALVLALVSVPALASAPALALAPAAAASHQGADPPAEEASLPRTLPEI
ncbi:MAG: hypothetical protein V3T22_07205, partial [Planctomycetota bacterium]